MFITVHHGREDRFTVVRPAGFEPATFGLEEIELISIVLPEVSARSALFTFALVRSFVHESSAGNLMIENG
jgi:hypothetical protein